MTINGAVEALVDLPKLPFLTEICRVLATNGILAVADTMPHGPEACRLELIGLGQRSGLEVVSFRDVTTNVFEACRNDDQRRSRLVNRLPRYLRPIAREWVSLPGTTQLANSSEGAVLLYRGDDDEEYRTLPLIRPGFDGNARDWL